MSVFRTATGASSSRLAGTLGIVLGAVSVVLGLLVLLSPQATLLVLAVLLGVELILLGVVRLIVTRLITGPGWARVLWLVMAVLTILAGLFCLIRPGASLLVVALLIAIGWIADGIAEIVLGLRGRGPIGNRVLAGFWGGTMIIAGLVVAVFPGESLVLLVRVAGAALIVVGAVQLVSGVSRHRGSAPTAGAA